MREGTPGSTAAARGGEVAEVRGAVLATGFERPPHAAAVEVEDGGKVSGC